MWHGLEVKWFGFEESILVPLIISGGGLPANLKHIQSDHIALNIDIAPTILSLAGVPAPGSMHWKDLVKSMQTKAARKDFFYEHTFMGSPRLPK
jgi:arylsulfatase A-like enzyme